MGLVIQFFMMEVPVDMVQQDALLFIYILEYELITPEFLFGRLI